VLYMVTTNDGKFREARELLAAYGIELGQIKDEKLEVQHDDVELIARVAAEEAFRRHRVPLIVDDTGLYVEALNGFPGPYSSYVISKVGLRGFLKLMEGVENRRACFRTAVAFADGTGVYTFTGETCGRIAEGQTRTYAEMGLEEKNAISHRGKALRAFASWYLARYYRPTQG